MLIRIFVATGGTQGLTKPKFLGPSAKQSGHLSPPHLPPSLELRRPHPVSREVALVDPGKGFFRSGDEAFAVVLDHRPFRPWAEAGDGFAPVAAGADDFRHLIGDGLAVSHPEGIGIADRPADDGVALGGTLVGPDEDFLQDAEVVELVNGD